MKFYIFLGLHFLFLFCVKRQNLLPNTQQENEKTVYISHFQLNKIPQSKYTLFSQLGLKTEKDTIFIRLDLKTEWPAAQDYVFISQKIRFIATQCSATQLDAQQNKEEFQICEAIFGEKGGEKIAIPIYIQKTVDVEGAKTDLIDLEMDINNFRPLKQINLAALSSEEKPELVLEVLNNQPILKPIFTVFSNVTKTCNQDNTSQTCTYKVVSPNKKNQKTYIFKLLYYPKINQIQWYKNPYPYLNYSYQELKNLKNGETLNVEVFDFPKKIEDLNISNNQKIQKTEILTANQWKFYFLDAFKNEITYFIDWKIILAIKKLKIKSKEDLSWEKSIASWKEGKNNRLSLKVKPELLFPNISELKLEWDNPFWKIENIYILNPPSAQNPNSADEYLDNDYFLQSNDRKISFKHTETGELRNYYLHFF